MFVCESECITRCFVCEVLICVLSSRRRGDGGDGVYCRNQKRNVGDLIDRNILVNTIIINTFRRYLFLSTCSDASSALKRNHSGDQMIEALQRN
jgi:hypothetical protein